MARRDDVDFIILDLSELIRNHDDPYRRKKSISKEGVVMFRDFVTLDIAQSILPFLCLSIESFATNSNWNLCQSVKENIPIPETSIFEIYEFAPPSRSAIVPIPSYNEILSIKDELKYDPEITTLTRGASSFYILERDANGSLSVSAIPRTTEEVEKSIYDNGKKFESLLKNSSIKRKRENDDNIRKKRKGSDEDDGPITRSSK